MPRLPAPIRRDASHGAAPIARIAVGVSARPEGRDAAVLGAALARAIGVDVMLITIIADPIVLPPVGVSWRRLRKEAQTGLANIRDEVMPDARTAVRTDLSVARALRRVVARDHCDLLIVGSSNKAPEGSVRIGKRVRQLIGYAGFPLAIAPRGMQHRPDVPLRRIGVGYDGGADSEAALSAAASISVAAGAELHVCGVVDDRAKAALWFAGGEAPALPDLDDLVANELDVLRERAVAAAHSLDPGARIDIRRGRPADVLLDLCADVDLLVIGSRRWGTVARLLLGSTGESLAFHATSPLMIVPRSNDRQ
jgi:nucleotide-binding universal stress UspA family protein